MEMTPITMLNHQAEMIISKGRKLAEQKTQLAGLVAHIKTSLGQARTRIDNQGEIQRVLETLQWEEHQKVLGTFEKLLGALLEDVFDEPRRVVMTMGISAGVTTLDLWLLKKDEIPADFDSLSLEERNKLNLEDAEQGTGGAVSNVLVTGLRLITLHKSGGRQFMVLDEADCWIKPALVGRFGEVVRQASQELGIQILMISHHDSDWFPQITHKLKLVKVNEPDTDGEPQETLTIETLKTTNSREGERGQTDPDEWQPDQAGMRSLDLVNFQAHSHTHLPLSPGVTLLSGDHDLGKSAIVRSLRAVFYGEGNDSLIKHQTNETKVIVEVEKGRVLIWERWRKPPKNKKKENYTLRVKANPEPLYNTAQSRGVPEWLGKELGIHLMGNLDVQLGKQKDPIFLLNQPGSVRAKALAIGHDSQYISSMMEKAKEEHSQAKMKIKVGEEQLEELARKISRRENAPEGDKLETWQRAVGQRQQQIEQGAQLQTRWSGATQQRRRRQALTQITLQEKVKTQPKLSLAQGLQQQWQKARNQQTSRQEILDYHQTECPQAGGRLGLAKQLEARWLEARKKQQARRQITALNPGLLASQAVELRNSLRILTGKGELEQRWRGRQQQQTSLNEALLLVGKQKQAQQKELDELKPAICPLCQQSWGKHLNHHDQEARDSQAKPRTGDAEQIPPTAKTTGTEIPQQGAKRTRAGRGLIDF